MFNDSNVMANTRNKKLGVKIVDNPYNKRESDPFNTKNVIQGKSPSISYEEKMKLVEKNQNLIASKLRDISPFFNGVKNQSFAPNQHKFVAVIGDRQKFDPIYNYENQKSETNAGNRDRSYNFKKLSNKEGSNQASVNTSMGEIESSKNNHNWWANRHDEVKTGEKNEKLAKKSGTDDNSNKFHGKKKFDFEESVGNKRTYQEEFNMKINQMHKENIDKKVQQRMEIQNKVMSKVISSTDYSRKEALIDNGNTLHEKYSIDYRKEREKARSQVLENMRNKMNINPGRKEVSDYDDMNNKLINENIFPK